MNYRNSRRSGDGFAVKKSRFFESEIGSLEANFESDKKRHGGFFAFRQLVLNALYQNGIIRGAAILALIAWQNLISLPAARLWSELKEEKSRRLNIDGLENVRGHKRDYSILLLMGLLIVGGLVLMYVLSPQWARFQNQTYGTDFASNHYFLRQVVNYVIAVGVFAAFSNIPLSFLYRKSRIFLGIGVFLCVLLAGLGALEIISGKNIPLVKCDKGACRWLEAGVSSQPAEFLKFGVLIAMSVFLGKRIKEKKVNNWKSSILPAMFLVIILLFFIALPPQKDLGTAISALAIVAFQLFVAGLSNKNIAKIGAVILAGGILLIASAPHRIERIQTFGKKEDCSNLSSAEKSDEYQICRAKIATGSGGLFGLGISGSVSTTGYLPEMINDSVFAAMAEIIGFVGLLAVLAVYFALIYRILRISNFMPNPTTRVMTAGIAGWFMVHAVMNISAIIGLIPLTGITIPLISYGGTSIAVISGILGLAFNASGYTTFSKSKVLKEADDENLGSRRRIGRTRDSRGRGF